MFIIMLHEQFKTALEKEKTKTKKIWTIDRAYVNTLYTAL